MTKTSIFLILLFAIAGACFYAVLMPPPPKPASVKPTDTAGLIKYGYNLFMKASLPDGNGDYEEAIAALKEVLRREPNNKEARGYLASCYNNRSHFKQVRHNYSGALADLDEAIQIDRNALYYNNRACLKMDRHDLNGALTDINIALQIDPNNAQYQLTRTGIIGLLTR